uniref:Uncharacterized protein n=1 Tax=viral metagenome TaxID=1070528 RepID=A0A6M3LEC4_9ZZZZ
MTTYLKEDFVFDADLVLEDSLDSAGAVSAIIASQAGTVLDVAKVVDLGDGVVEGYMIVDIDEILCSAADVLYEIWLQGSNVAAFATAGLIRNLAGLELGAGELLTNATATTGDQGAAGDRYVVPFRNVINGTVYRYVRVYQEIANGTGETITDTIWLSIKRK